MIKRIINSWLRIMAMLIQRIAPRPAALQVRGKYENSKPLSKAELAVALLALKNTGIADIATRFMDDCGRYAIDELLEII